VISFWSLQIDGMTGVRLVVSRPISLT